MGYLFYSSAARWRPQPAALAEAFGSPLHALTARRPLLQALFDLEATNAELKADLRDLYITSAKEVDVANGARKAIIIHVSSIDSGGAGALRGLRGSAGRPVLRLSRNAELKTGSRLCRCPTAC